MPIRGIRYPKVPTAAGIKPGSRHKKSLPAHVGGRLLRLRAVTSSQEEQPYQPPLARLQPLAGCTGVDIGAHILHNLPFQRL